MRKYDIGLLLRMKEKTYIKNVDGVDIMFKPVPDDEREHVIDSRIVQIIRNKQKMFSQRAKGGFSISSERYRPDKVTYDLTTTEIDVQERLIPIDNDHMIDIFLHRRKDEIEKVPVLIYLHGGGFTAGDHKLFVNQMKLIAELANALVVFPEYRLAPECPFPGAIQDACGTIKWIVEHAEELNVDVNRLMVAGDSAGGSLTNACILLDENKYIKKAFEIYPGCDSSDYRQQQNYLWSYDLYPVIEEHKEYAFNRINRIKSSVEKDENANLYLQGKTTSKNPLVSVVYATDEQLKEFPPLVVVSSEYDYLRIGSNYFVKRLTDLGKDVKSICYCGCDHGFFDLLGTLVQTEDLCMLISEELKNMLKETKW